MHGIGRRHILWALDRRQGPRSFGVFASNERFGDSAIFRSVFERVVGACIGAGLVGGEGFAVDASLIAADDKDLTHNR
jgi:transposase